jgi:DnaK suppressor protein
MGLQISAGIGHSRAAVATPTPFWYRFALIFFRGDRIGPRISGLLQESGMPARKLKKAQTAASVSPVEGIKPYAAKKGEKYMNKKQLAHFRDVLNAWKKDLENEITRTVHAMRDEPENPPDPNDRASQETDMSLELRSRDRERKLIKKINEAIARIDENEYGYCDVCGVEIGNERLEARPTAELCIDCKTLDEIREKQMG